MGILEEIAGKRRREIEKMGHAPGTKLPERRSVPLIPFGASPSGTGSRGNFIICEIKRSSPSRGSIAKNISAPEIAGEYARYGVNHISVLTERNYFSGSLDDLLLVKNRLPDTAVLRKDFLLDEEDIEVSYRAGADAVLLIAKLLPRDLLERMYRRAKEFGMEALVEVHDKEDIDKIRDMSPTLTGINSRNLKDFSVDRGIPLQLKGHIDWETTLVFESGIISEEDALVAAYAGFKGMLVGEAVVREPELIGRIMKEISSYPAESNFWGRLFERAARKKRNQPLVKICGITTERDAKAAADNGADIIGFVFAPSKRRADANLPERLKDLEVLKVAVVVAGDGGEARAKMKAAGGKNQFEYQHGEWPDSVKLVRSLLREGLIDAVQFHGSERPDQCFEMAFPYYKAVRVREAGDIEAMDRYRCPRVLADAYSEKAMGGTGERIGKVLLAALRKRGPLWLAGGINPENVTSIIENYRPELIDLSSGVEKVPGEKDAGKIQKLFREIRRV